MKRNALLGVALLLVGVLSWWVMQTASFATHNPNADYDATLGVGTADDNTDDSTPDHPGSDYDNDRSPDRANRDANTPYAGDGVRDRAANMDRNLGPFSGDGDMNPDREAPRSGAKKDHAPDCGNGPGDGNCGGGGGIGNSPFSGDGTQDNFGAGDDFNDNTPDRPSPLNRIGDSGDDGAPDRTNTDRYLLTQGLASTVNDRGDSDGNGVPERDCDPGDVANGECDNNTTNQLRDNNPDRVGRETNRDFELDGSTSDRVGAKDCAPADVALGECSRNFTANSDDPKRPDRDGDGNGSGCDGGTCGDLTGDGTPDRIADRATPAELLALGADNIPDGIFSRTNRDAGRQNHAQAARDAFLFGPNDRVKDGKSDEGGLGFAPFSSPTAHPNAGDPGAPGAEGDEGDACSFSPVGTVHPFNAIAFLLILLSPLALIAMRRMRSGMLKMMVWGGGLAAVGLLAWMSMQSVSFATHDPNAGYNPASGVGAPQDEVDDHSPDRPGGDHNGDRSPDRTNRDAGTANAGDGCGDRSRNQDDCGLIGAGDNMPDRIAPRTANVKDHTPDCINGPGDGNCGFGPNASDSHPDQFGAGDDTSDSTPDQPIVLNRIGENVKDTVSDRPNTDRYVSDHGGTMVRDRINARDCNPADIPSGECDRVTVNMLDDGYRDRQGREGENHDWTVDGAAREGTPDRAIVGNADDPRRPNRDGDANGAGCDGGTCGDSTSDGVPDRINDRIIADNRDSVADGIMSRPNRDAGRQNHAQAARDSFSFGPSDRAKDDKSDRGGLGFGAFDNPESLFPEGAAGAEGGEGDDGCSFSAAGMTSAKNVMAYLAILLSPLALVAMRRKRSGMKKAILLGIGVLTIGLLAWIQMQTTTLADHDPNANYDPALGVGTREDETADVTPDHPGSDRSNDRTPDRADRDQTADFPARDRATNMDRGDATDATGNGDNGGGTAGSGPGAGNSLGASAQHGGIPNREGDRDRSAADQTSARDRATDETADCGNGPGDGSCGNGPTAGDNQPDNFGAGDDFADRTPDRPHPLNRPGEAVFDGISDRPNTDRYLGSQGDPLTVGDRQGVRDCLPEHVALGECDNDTTNQMDDGNPDRVGRDGNANSDFVLDGTGSDGTPDRTAASIAARSDDPARPTRDGDGNGSQGELTPDRVTPTQDDGPAGGSNGIPDGQPSRTQKDFGFWNHSSTARDTYQFGPSDYSRDGKSDLGGLGFAALTDPTERPTGDTGDTGATGGSGDDGCSFSPTGEVKPYNALAYLLILLTPLALVGMRKLVRR